MTRLRGWLAAVIVLSALAAPGTLVRDPALWLSVDNVRRGLDEGSLVLVDVREEPAVAAAPLPGALVIPLHAVKAREFLRRRLFVLVGEGGEWRALEDACRALRQAGFDQAHSLDGGFVAWAAATRPDAGSHARSPLPSLSAATLYQTAAYADCVILAGDGRLARAAFRDGAAHILDASDAGDESVHARLTEVLRGSATSPRPMVVIAGSDSLAEQVLVHPVLTNAAVWRLAGGVEGYLDFVETLDRSRSRPRRERTTVTTATGDRSCATCP